MKQGDFAEMIAIPQQGDSVLRAIGLLHGHRHLATRDQIETISRIAFVNDLAIGLIAFRVELLCDGVEQICWKLVQERRARRHLASTVAQSPSALTVNPLCLAHNSG